MLPRPETGRCVGIAMGAKGSEAAREASSMVLLDVQICQHSGAVREGRSVYTNLKKVIAFMLPINGGESISLIELTGARF